MTGLRRLQPAGMRKERTLPTAWERVKSGRSRMSANAALAPEDGRIKNVSGAALFVKYGPARKRENSERGHARRRSVRAFEHSGQSRSPVCKRTAQMIHIFTPALAIAS